MKCCFLWLHTWAASSPLIFPSVCQGQQPLSPVFRKGCWSHFWEGPKPTQIKEKQRVFTYLASAGRGQGQGWQKVGAPLTASPMKPSGHCSQCCPVVFLWQPCRGNRQNAEREMEVLQQKCQSHSGVAARPASNCMCQKGKSPFSDSKTKQKNPAKQNKQTNKKRVSAGKYCQQTWVKTRVSTRLLWDLMTGKEQLELSHQATLELELEGWGKGFHSCSCARNFAASLNQNSPVTALCMDTVQMWAANLETARKQIHGRQVENYSVSVYLL